MHIQASGRAVLLSRTGPPSSTEVPTPSCSYTNLSPSPNPCARPNFLALTTSHRHTRYQGPKSTLTGGETTTGAINSVWGCGSRELARQTITRCMRVFYVCACGGWGVVCWLVCVICVFLCSLFSPSLFHLRPHLRSAGHREQRLLRPRVFRDSHGPGERWPELWRWRDYLD